MRTSLVAQTAKCLSTARETRVQSLGWEDPLYTLCLHAQLLSCVQLFSTPWTIAYQAPLSMGFSRQEYWSGLLFPSSGDLPNPGIEPGSSTVYADAFTV